MTSKFPNDLEVYGYFSVHLGPRFAAAGLRIQFYRNQTPGIYFETQPPEEYRESIIKGLQDGLVLRFPEYPATGCIRITEIIVHTVDSSQRAFYRAGRMAIDQAFSLVETSE